MTRRLSKTGTFKINRDATANYTNEKHRPLIACEYKIMTYSDGTFKVTPKESPAKKTGRKTAKKTAAKRKTSIYI